jgi:hypothetical protein
MPSVRSGNSLPDLVVAISELRHSAMLPATRAGYAAKSVTHAELEEDCATLIAPKNVTDAARRGYVGNG